MPNTRTIAEALRYSDEDVAHVERRGRRWRLITLVLMWLYPAVIILVFAWRAEMSWSDGLWDTHIWSVDLSLFSLFMHLPLAAVLLLPFLGFDFLMAQSRMRRGLALLREAAIEGDERLAPRATMQPAPYPSPLLTDRIVPIILPTQLGDKNYIRLMGLSFAALPMSIMATSILALVLPATDDIHMAGLVFGGAAFVLAVPIWLVLRRRPRRGGQTTILVDADGVSWAVSPTASTMRATLLSLFDARKVRVRWQDLRTFLTYACDDAGIGHRLYALATAGEMFTWEVRGDLPDDARAASELLCRLIATYTALPLRDLSASVALLDDVTPRAAVRWSGRMREARATHASIAPARTLDGIRMHHMRACPAMIGLMVLTVLPSLLYISMYSAQRYQARVYADLLAQVHAHAPIYHDALNVADSDWPLHTPTMEEPYGFVFARGAYQLSGETHDGYVFALTSNRSGVVDGDMAVEVTARQYGGPDYLGVGLTLHDTDADEDAVVFTVAPSGEWMLHSPAQTRTLFSFQGKQYVHGQAGAPNRLTLIARQGEYIAYINGQLVGIERGSMRHAGSVGVAMLGTPSMTGAFTDLTVYSL